jgi:hypothetical protein
VKARAVIEAESPKEFIKRTNRARFDDITFEPGYYGAKKISAGGFSVEVKNGHVFYITIPDGEGGNTARAANFLDAVMRALKGRGIYRVSFNNVSEADRKMAPDLTAAIDELVATRRLQYLHTSGMCCFYEIA